ncbi:MFS transporter [Paraburkholderia sp. RL17-347-BIC-D]|uniref:MFS transporter n=1 Tax=Paraburkholderia sp. RL17-347-BIC-D TaxID=3031632 RepID=UPI0038B77D17
MEAQQPVDASSSSRRSLVVTTVLLALAFTFSYMDRQVLSLLLEPVRHKFSLTDTEIGMLQGLSFGAFYACSGLVLGALVDRYHRVGIAAACVAAWGLATAACGVSGNFVQLFLSRTGTAIGEAGCSPASYSILSDLTSGRKLLRATAVYHTGPYIGGGMALVLGSAALSYFTRAGGMTLPVIGHIDAWQAVFIILGLPGILLAAAILLTLREPTRREHGSDVDVSTRATLKFLFSSSQLMRYYAGFVFVTAGLYVLLAWFPSVMIREGLGSAAEIGHPLGTIFLVIGLAGCLASQVLLRRLDNRDLLHPLLKRLSIVVALQIPVTAAFLMADTAALAYWLYGCEVVTFSAVTTFMVAPIQLTVPNRMRGRATGLFMTFNYLLGASLGPALVGVLSDRLRGSHSLLIAFVVVLCVSSACSALLFYASSRRCADVRNGDHLRANAAARNT